MWVPTWTNGPPAGRTRRGWMRPVNNETPFQQHLPLESCPMAHALPSYFPLHLVSDSTGETLTTIAKAASVQYAMVRPIEHVHPLVRTPRQLKRVLQEIEQAPGIVLYTITNKDLSEQLELRCTELKLPCLAVLQPI